MNESRLPAVQALRAEDLTALIEGLPLEAARKYLASWHRDEVIRPRPGLAARWIEAITAAVAAPRLPVAATATSAVDGFARLLFDVGGAGGIEAVRIPLEQPGRFHACVSSQAGCALACRFCATGTLGLSRNLETWEIVEQVRAVRATVDGAGRVRGVLFQGMGEPLANLDRVVRAIAVITAPYALAIDTRSITVCTAGLPDGILRLAADLPKVRLGVSIGAIDETLRAQIMPITKAHSLASVLDAVAVHARTTRLVPMWAITLLAGVNDGPGHAAAVAERALAFRADTGITPRLTLLDYNSRGPGDPFARANEATLHGFRKVLADHGLPHHRRYSGGADIAAACGQLAASKAPRPLSKRPD